MTLEAFVASRTGRWEELEALLRRGRRGRLRDVAAGELERFGWLYRQAASDLAIARRDFAHADVTVYLNELCARAHPVLYRPRAGGPIDVLRTVVTGIPRAFRARRTYVLLSLGLILAGAVAGWLAVDLRPDLRSSLVPQSGFDELARGNVSSLPSAPLLGTVIITNNIKVAVVCFLGGALLGLPTAAILAANGWMLGSIAAAVHLGGYDLAFWSLIVPHGVLELSIIVIAGATGLQVGDAILRPGVLRRGDAFTKAALGAAGLALGTASLLVIAGLLESYVSPSPLPAPVKLLVGSLVGAVLYSWLLLAGRSRPRSTPVSLDVTRAGSPSRAA